MGSISLKVEDELAKINRRLDSIQKQQDLLFADRGILESIQGRITSLEEQTRLSREHDNEVRKDIKEEINIANDRTVAKVEQGVEDIQTSLEKSDVPVVKKNRKWFFWRR